MTRTELEFLILKHCSVETYNNKGEVEAYSMSMNSVINDLVKAYKKEYKIKPRTYLSIKASDFDNLVDNMLVELKSIFKIKD